MNDSEINLAAWSLAKDHVIASNPMEAQRFGDAPVQMWPEWARSEHERLHLSLVKFARRVKEKKP